MAEQLISISPYCRVHVTANGPRVEAREHRYGSFLPATGDLFLSAIAIRELAQYVVERKRASDRREPAKV
jgi:hypothetical protein